MKITPKSNEHNTFVRSDLIAEDGSETIGKHSIPLWDIIELELN